MPPKANPHGKVPSTHERTVIKASPHALADRVKASRPRPSVATVGHADERMKRSAR